MKYLPSLLTLFCFIILTSCSSDEAETIPQPQASFSFSSDNHFAAPSKVTFTNESINAQQYSWDFGDGSPLSNNVNPIHEFSSPGKYTVILIASNEFKFHQISKEVEIVDMPKADFSFSSDNNFLAPTTVSFNNDSQSSSSYLWDFGDGQTSTLENPTHKFDTPGNYIVSLTAKSNAGEDVIEKEVSVHSSNSLLIEKFEGTWNAQAVTYDADDMIADYGSFQIAFAKGSSDVMTFTTSGRPAKLTPWPASGTFTFGSPSTSQLVRDDGVTIDYDVNTNSLQLTMENYSGTGYNGRTSTVAGDWVFTLTK